MRDSSWGDGIMIKAFCFTFGARLTVLNCKVLTETRFRHNLPMQKADIVLVHNGDGVLGHYSAASEFSVTFTA